MERTLRTPHHATSSCPPVQMFPAGLTAHFTISTENSLTTRWPRPTTALLEHPPHPPKAADKRSPRADLLLWIPGKNQPNVAPAANKGLLAGFAPVAVDVPARKFYNLPDEAFLGYVGASLGWPCGSQMHRRCFLSIGLGASSLRIHMNLSGATFRRRLIKTQISRFARKIFLRQTGHMRSAAVYRGDRGRSHIHE